MIVFLLLCDDCDSFLLIPFLGSLGTALATATTHVFSMILLRHFSWKYMELRI
jgi:O-antigen/teichoic acid export membrane protein